MNCFYANFGILIVSMFVQLGLFLSKFVPNTIQVQAHCTGKWSNDSGEYSCFVIGEFLSVGCTYWDHFSSRHLFVSLVISAMLSSCDCFIVWDFDILGMQAPSFITAGDRVVIDTSDNSYVTRLIPGFSMTWSLVQFAFNLQLTLFCTKGTLEQTGPSGSNSC